MRTKTFLWVYKRGWWQNGSCFSSRTWLSRCKGGKKVLTWCAYACKRGTCSWDNFRRTKSRLGYNEQVIITWLIVLQVWLINNALQVCLLHFLYIVVSIFCLCYFLTIWRQIFAEAQCDQASLWNIHLHCHFLSLVYLSAESFHLF